MRSVGLSPLEDGKSISAPKLADHLGMSRNAVYEAIKRGEIQATRIGRRLVIPAHVSRKLLGLDGGAA